MKEQLESLRQHASERARLLEMLGIWDVVKGAGYSPDDVVSFGFSSAFCTDCDRETITGRIPPQMVLNGVVNPSDVFAARSADWINYVRLRNGERRQIPLTRKPEGGDA